MNKELALEYVLKNCTKFGLCENISSFYVKINKEELTWDTFDLFNNKFKKLGYFTEIYSDIFKVSIETRVLESKLLDLIYNNYCEIVENDYLDNKYNYKLSFKLIELLEDYFESVKEYSEYQMGSTLEDKILKELNSIKNNARV